MAKKILHSAGIVVCEGTYLDGMWQVQRAEDAGGNAVVSLGRVHAILPMEPTEEKYMECMYCAACELIVACKEDRIDPSDVPAVAKY
jgi:hypothetical protein